jgi:hypothetical protein
MNFSKKIFGGYKKSLMSSSSGVLWVVPPGIVPIAIGTGTHDIQAEFL